MNPRETDADYHRITYALGGEKATRWADSVQVAPEGDLSFVDVETGHKRFVSDSVPFIVTEIDELPPAVEESVEEEMKL